MSARRLIEAAFAPSAATLPLVNARRAFSREIEAYLGELEQTGASELSLKTARRELERYGEWLIAHEVLTPKKIGVSDVESYEHDLRALPPPNARTRGRLYSSASIGQKLAVVRRFHRFLARERGHSDATANQTTSPAKRTLPLVLESAQVVTLLRATNGDEATTLRDRALLELLYATGARAAQICQLQTNDIDWESGTIKIRGARSKVWRVALSRACVRALKNYLESGRKSLLQSSARDESARRGRPRSAPMPPKRATRLFVLSGGGTMEVGDVNAIVKRWAQEAKLPTWVSAQTLRHSLGVHLVEGGADLKTVSDILGLATPASAQLYAEIDARRRRDTFLRAHPRS